MNYEYKKQQKADELLSALNELIALSEAKVQKLEQLKKELMQKIFSHKVWFKREDGTSYPEWEEKRFNNMYNDKYAYYLLEYNNVQPTECNQHFSKLNKMVMFTSVDLEEQQKIADFFSSFDRFIALTNKKIEKLKNIKKGMF